MQDKIISLNISDEIKARLSQWLTEEYDEDIKNEIKELIEKNNLKEIEDRFFKDLEFGTGGLRGVIGAGTNRMNKYNIWKATQGLANYLKNQFRDGRIKVVIAFDSRHKSDLFSKETAMVLAGNKIQAFLFESLRPTPELSFAVRHLKAQAGIVITASHNPPEYNGYKVYWEDGGQIVPPHDKNIISEVNKIAQVSQVQRMKEKEAIDKGFLKIIGQEVDKAYLQKIKSLSLNPDIIQKVSYQLRIVYSPIHGSGNLPVRHSLENFGFKNVFVVKEQELPDGNFPTVKSPNPEESEALEMSINLAKEMKADFLIATDPDCDRMGVAVRQNNDYVLLNGNQIASLLCHYILSQRKDKGLLPDNALIIKTIVTTDLITCIAQNFGVEVYEVLTGFKYIGEKIKIQDDLKKDGKSYKEYIFGGEESYGYLAGTFVRDKDAVISSSLFSEMVAYLKYHNKDVLQYLNDIYSEFGYYTEALKSMTLKGKAGLEKITQIMERFRTNPPQSIGPLKVLRIGDILKNALIDVNTQKVIGNYDLPGSNVLVLDLEKNIKISLRPSGTEPKIKFYFAASSQDTRNLSETRVNVDNLLLESIHHFLDYVKKI
ncbi:MAG: phospho-sugar mutase [Spirochaetes bacterium]|nr:phospho-sugar mutase [Spirochaetota bacterium]